MPPTAQQAKPKGVPGLKIGGLGMSSVVQGGETKTAEELSVLQDVGKKFVQTKKVDSDDSSDGYIPAPVQQTKPKGLPSLKITGLGSSTLVQEGQSTTAEDASVQLILLPPGAQSNFQQTPQSTHKIMLPVQEQNESEESDDFLPPAQPAVKPRFVPGLKIGGIGMSTVVRDGQTKTAEELDVEKDAGYRPEDRVIDLRP